MSSPGFVDAPEDALENRQLVSPEQPKLLEELVLRLHAGEQFDAGARQLFADRDQLPRKVEIGKDAENVIAAGEPLAFELGPDRGAEQQIGADRRVDVVAVGREALDEVGLLVVGEPLGQYPARLDDPRGDVGLRFGIERPRRPSR